MAVAEAWQDAARASGGAISRRCSATGPAGLAAVEGVHDAAHPADRLVHEPAYVATGNPARPMGNDRNLLWGWLLSTQNYPDDPVRARVPEPQAANSETGPASESHPFGEMTFGLFIRYPAFRP
jgi:hypothetical protein